MAWRWNGGVGLVTAAPLWGVSLARPMMELLEEVHHFNRWLVHRKSQGRHCAYHGHSLQLLDDAKHQRWVALSEVRRVLPDLPAHAHFEAIAPGSCAEHPGERGVWIKVEALSAYLVKASTPEGLRFRHWVDRTLVFPSQRRRALLRGEVPVNEVPVDDPPEAGLASSASASAQTAQTAQAAHAEPPNPSAAQAAKEAVARSAD